MADEGFKRKLTAILSADVIGYSRLMRDDEEATVRDIAAHRVLISDIVQQHHGRVVDSPGDNILAEFASVVDAVNGAIKIQEKIKRSNLDTPINRRMEFRIGINLGDVIEEEERIYGDGVNIAARVEGLAAGGGIAISGTVYEHIKEKLSLGYHYLGEQDVKNISEPVRVYRLLTESDDAGKVIGEEKPKSKKSRFIAVSAFGLIIVVVGTFVIWNNYFRAKIEPASVEKMAFPLPEKPSIAVLPFDNMISNPEQKYFADGITENIISALSKIPEMFVIARNSTFTYKNKSVKIQKVSEELGVRYVLEGSVQKSGNRIRITAQLVDATKGHHLWSETYDRDIKDLFDLQDEITKEIVVALQVKLTEGEQARIRHRSTSNLQAWGNAVKAYSLFERYTKEDNAKARELFEKAIKLDPQYAWAWTWLAWTHWVDARYGFSESRTESFKHAVRIAQKAMALDNTGPDVHALLGTLHLYQRNHEGAIAEGNKAIVLGPNNAENHALLALTMFQAGNFEEAITLAEKSLRLSPHYPSWYLLPLGASKLFLHRPQEALEAFNRCLERSKKEGGAILIFSHLYLAATYSELGRDKEAINHIEEIFKINPKFSLQWVRKASFLKNPKHLQRWIDALRRAGLPETPPLPLPDKPSIAVLAFDNLSGDPEQEYFSDGIADDIITALSKTPKIFVIARNSSFTYKGKPVKVQQVGRDLGVRYVLEGSVRKVGEKVRITAQLIDARTGHHLWAEKYDRELGDIFAVQDEITKKIILELHIKLTHGEQARIYSKGTDNIDVYLMAMQAQWYSYLWNKNRNLEARRLVEKAIVLAPDYAYAYRILGMTHVVDIFVGLSQSPKKSLALAMDAYKKAISLDKSLASAYLGMSFVLTMVRKHDEAVSIGKKAIELEPNSADVLQGYASILTFSGMVEEAIPLFREVRRLNPIPSNSYYHSFGHALRLSGKYEEAIALQKKAIRQEPDDHLSYIILGYSASLAGRDEEAQAAVKELLRIKPNFSVMYLIAPFKDRTVLEQNCEALNKAGLSLNCDALRKTASK